MVLENVFTKKAGFLELNAILLLVNFVSIVLARFIFGSNAGIVSVVFISLFLFLISQKYADYKDSLYFYVIVFFNVFLCYLFAAFVLPQMGINVFNIFQEQLNVTQNIVGEARGFDSTSILFNNFIVLLVCFLLGVLGGNVFLFFLLWNASAWGSVFGFISLNYGIISQINPFIVLFSLLTVIIWHTALEGLTYIFGGISGKLLSQTLLSHKNIMLSVIVSILIFLLLVFSRLFFSNNGFIGVFLSLIFSALIFIGVWLFFSEKSKDIKMSAILFGCSLILLVLAYYVEVFVILNSSLLSSISFAGLI